MFRCKLSCTSVVILLLCPHLDTEVSITYISTKYSFSNCSCGHSTNFNTRIHLKLSLCRGPPIPTILYRSYYSWRLVAWEALSLDTFDLYPGVRIPSQLLLVGMKCYASGTPRRTVHVLYLKSRPWSPRPCPPSNRHAYIRPAEHVTLQLVILHIYYFFFSCFSFLCYF